MFVVLYEIKIKAGFEDEFRKAWHDLTQAIIGEMGSLGARLHRRADGTFIAYAQWPSRELWQKGHHHIEQEAVKMHLDQGFIEVPTVLMELDVLDDLLVK
jgi:heme-degrading monooxygenase HmoA